LAKLDIFIHIIFEHDYENMLFFNRDRIIKYSGRKLKMPSEFTVVKTQFPTVLP
jgi:hypothetical protein